MQEMARRGVAMLGVLVGLGSAGMIGACVTGVLGGPGEPEPGAVAPGVDPPVPQPACPASDEIPCMRYHIPLDGNPSSDVALRNKYVAAFGSACYMSVVNTFDCFYKKEQMTPKGKACTDAKMIAEVAGAAPFSKDYDCEEVKGTENWSLQVGPDPANKIYINYQAAPRQSPLVEVGGVPTEVNGPYRNLVEFTAIEPGKDFEDDSGFVGADGNSLTQRKWILEVNRKNHDDKKIHSDLAGFMFPCNTGSPKLCPEPEVLNEPPGYLDAQAEVHHAVPKQDKRCCPWGTNAYKNAAVISHKLNVYFTNNNPPEEEVKRLNTAAAFTP